MNRLYSDIGHLLDEKFRMVYNLTYNTMATHEDVDTTMLRRALFNYVHCMFGIRYGHHRDSCVCVLSCFSRVQLFETPRTVALQVLLSMGFFWQEYWSGLPFPFPGDLPNPGIKPKSPASPVLAGRFFTIVPSGKIYLRNPVDKGAW